MEKKQLKGDRRIGRNYRQMSLKGLYPRKAENSKYLYMRLAEAYICDNGYAYRNKEGKSPIGLRISYADYAFSYFRMHPTKNAKLF